MEVLGCLQVASDFFWFQIMDKIYSVVAVNDYGMIFITANTSEIHHLVTAMFIIMIRGGCYTGIYMYICQLLTKCQVRATGMSSIVVVQ